MHPHISRKKGVTCSLTLCTGLEPVISWLTVKRSTDWANRERHNNHSKHWKMLQNQIFVVQPRPTTTGCDAHPISHFIGNTFVHTQATLYIQCRSYSVFKPFLTAISMNALPCMSRIWFIKLKCIACYMLSGFMLCRCIYMNYRRSFFATTCFTQEHLQAQDRPMYHSLSLKGVLVSRCPMDNGWIYKQTTQWPQRDSNPRCCRERAVS